MCFVSPWTHSFLPSFPFFFSNTGFLSVALDVLELSLLARLALNSEILLALLPKCWTKKHAPLPTWLRIHLYGRCHMCSTKSLYAVTFGFYLTYFVLDCAHRIQYSPNCAVLNYA